MRGCCARRHERSTISRIAIPRDFSAVPGTDESGRTCTSTVARAGCSAARRAVMGPLTEARAEQEGWKENLADPSTPSRPSSEEMLIDRRTVDDMVVLDGRLETLDVHVFAKGGKPKNGVRVPDQVFSHGHGGMSEFSLISVKLLCLDIFQGWIAA